MPPHATEELTTTTTNGTMSQTMTNGETPSSVFISHLISYPVISDSIKTYKQHPLGAKSLSLFDTAYSTAYSNIYSPLSPYLKTPYSYISPYLAKADSLGDSGLSNLESRFPIVKEPTSSIYEKAQAIVGYPFKVAGQGKDLALDTYKDEYSKVGGEDGLVKKAKALIGADIRLAGLALSTVAGYLTTAKKEAKEAVDKKMS